MVSRLTDVERSSVGNEFDAHNRGRHAETPCSQLRPRSKNYKCALTCNSFRQDKTAAVVVSEFSVRDVSCSDAARMRTVAVSTVPFVCVESTVAALHTYRFPPIVSLCPIHTADATVASASAVCIWLYPHFHIGHLHSRLVFRDPLWELAQMNWGMGGGRSRGVLRGLRLPLPLEVTIFLY